MVFALPHPGPPFNPTQLRVGADLVGAAYSAAKLWREQKRPDPDQLDWEPPVELGFERLLWASAFERGPFADPQPLGLIARRDGVVWLALRGTDNPLDFLVDVNIRQTDYAVPGGVGRVHSGFWSLYEALREPLFEQLGSLADVEAVVVVGHSMGAGVSTLAVPDLARNAGLDLGRQTLTHYGLGAPRVGDPAFADALDALAEAHDHANVMSYRIVNTADPITNAPPAVINRLVAEDELYQHAGTVVSFSRNHGSVAANHHFSRCYVATLDDTQERPSTP
ncbi:lipase family protein [Haliangium sp.]|uniref:lipase family protein n=1 Tax=Haliangium sp. TaxID=2663208 RepID=UPI003D130B08